MTKANIRTLYDLKNIQFPGTDSKAFFSSDESKESRKSSNTTSSTSSLDVPW